MDYQTFKNRILNELRDFYGNDAEVRVVNVLDANGLCHEGICLETKEKDAKGKEALVSSTMSLERLYGSFASGSASLEQCAGMIVDANREQTAMVKEMETM